MFRSPRRRREPQQPGLTAHDGRTGPRTIATHYTTLGLTRDARARDIVRAYRRLAKRLHPDVSPDAAGANHFARASVAYDVLSDPARRAAYDASLDAAAAALPPARRGITGSRAENAILVGLAVLACVGLLYIVAFALGLRGDAGAGAPPTDVPEGTAADVVPSPSVPARSASPTPLRTATAPPQVAPPTPVATPQPPTASPTPSPAATPSPQPSPTPSPTTPPPVTQSPGPPPPSATPARCVVPTVIGQRKNSVLPIWQAAGFSTPVTFLPGTGNYQVATQTPAAGSSGPCATTTLTVGP